MCFVTIYQIYLLHASGVQQFVPTDYETRISDYQALLQDLMRRRQYTTIVVGDETGVRMEDIPTETMESRGAKSVKLRTSGKERTLFTVWLWSTIEKAGDDWVCVPMPCIPEALNFFATDC